MPEVVCNCAHVPPTVPVYRSKYDHLAGCPVGLALMSTRAQWMAFCAEHGHIRLSRINGGRCLRCDTSESAASDAPAKSRKPS